MDFFKRYGAPALLVCQSHVSRYRRAWVVVCILVAFIFGVIVTSAPANFSLTIVAIPQGTSAPEVVRILTDAHVIKHPSLLRFALRVSGASNSVQAGAYRFSKPQNVLTVAYRLIMGDYDLPTVRITFPEGITIREATVFVAGAFPLISATALQQAAGPYEGYLFPDTYFFSPGADAESIVETMRANFNTKITSLASDLAASGRSLSDIVIMASLVEKEARSIPHKRTVAGILYNRLALGMPLQVDAVFGYIYGRDTYSPSFDDLKVDSPYNTYIHTGLPPGPIDNPGLDSLEAVLHPTKTNYLYYLTGIDGFMHYATTYAGHQANQKKNLR